MARQVRPAIRQQKRARRSASAGDGAGGEANAQLQSAFALDRAGRQAEAIPLYRRAIALGLEAEPLRDALICLGSSLRNVVQFKSALRCLHRARRQFQNDIVIELFLALVHHDLGQPERALQLVALSCLRESGAAQLPAYRDVLQRRYRSLTRR